MLATAVSAPVLPAPPAAGSAGAPPEADTAERPFARVLGREAERRAAESRPAPGTRAGAAKGDAKTEPDDTDRTPPQAQTSPALAEGVAEALETAPPAAAPDAEDPPAADAWALLAPLLPPRTPAAPAAPADSSRTPGRGTEATAVTGAGGHRGRAGSAPAPDTATLPEAAPPPTAEEAPGPTAEPRFTLPAPAMPRPAAPEGPIAAPAAPAPAAPATTAPAAEAAIAAPPGSPAFATELGTKLATFVRDGIEHARLELHPVELGPVTVQIQLDGVQAQVNLSAEQAPTRQALEQALPALAGSLREAGLTLSGGGVFEQPRQPAQAGGAGGGGARGRRGGEGADDGLPGLAAAPVAPRRRGVVDLVA